MRRLNIIFLILVIFLSSISLGFASWNFSGDAEVESNTQIIIGDFSFEPIFLGKDCLDKQTLNINDQFLHALNNMDNIYDKHGQALVHALIFSVNDEYVGNRDKHHFVYISLDIMMDVPNGCTYVITRDEDDNFSLYVTYKNLHNYSYGDRVTTYQINYEIYDTEYYPVSASKGTCIVSAYDMSDYQIQKSINPASFKVK